MNGRPPGSGYARHGAERHPTGVVGWVWAAEGNCCPNNYPCRVTPRLEGAIKQGRLLAAGVTITALAACAGAVAGPGNRPNCFPPHTQTIAKDRNVRVYSLAGRLAAYGGTYACLLRRGTIVTLTKPGPRRSALIDRVTLAGAIIAYTYSTHGVDTGSTGIAVVDATSGRHLLTIPGVGGFADACVISFSQVTDLVVTHHGSVAWIVRKGARCQTTTFEVHSAQVSGTPALLEEGSAILPESLRFSHGTVTWENAGQQRSAHLP
jgi:hypothetical protein